VYRDVRRFSPPKTFYLVDFALFCGTVAVKTVSFKSFCIWFMVIDWAVYVTSTTRPWKKLVGGGSDLRRSRFASYSLIR